MSVSHHSINNKRKHKKNKRIQIQRNKCEKKRTYRKKYQPKNMQTKTGFPTLILFIRQGQAATPCYATLRNLDFMKLRVLRKAGKSFVKYPVPFYLLARHTR